MTGVSTARIQDCFNLTEQSFQFLIFQMSWLPEKDDVCSLNDYFLQSTMVKCSGQYKMPVDLFGRNVVDDRFCWSLNNVASSISSCSEL